MKTIGEVYNPLIKIAVIGDIVQGKLALVQVAQMLFNNNKDKCNSLEEAVEQVKINLDYYCQYFPKKTMLVVKKFYCLGSGFRSLNGIKL